MYDKEKESKETLYELEGLIRSRPPNSTIRPASDENIEWFGRAQAVIRRWDQFKAIAFDADVRIIHGLSTQAKSNSSYVNVLIMLNMAQNELRMLLEPSTDIVIEAGKTYQYFEGIRRVVELSTSEVFFIDPYIDADFVSRYLVYVKEGVSVRILTKQYIRELVSAVRAFSEETNIPVEVRSARELHDRYLITDNRNCYQSGASFKDGGKNAPTTLVEINDVYKAVLEAYEAIWELAEKHA